MSVIKFTDADVMATTVVEAGIYPTEVTEISNPSASTSGKSVHYWTTFKITEGKYTGKEHKLSFNSETQSPSLLGEMQFYPVAYILALYCALEGCKPSAAEVDTDNMVGRSFDAQWGVATVDGRLVNTILAFYPKGYGKSAPAF